MSARTGTKPTSNRRTRAKIGAILSQIIPYYQKVPSAGNSGHQNCSKHLSALVTRPLTSLGGRATRLPQACCVPDPGCFLSMPGFFTGNPPGMPRLDADDRCGLITTVPGRDFRFAKAPMASKFAPGEFVIFSPTGRAFAERIGV